MSLLEAATNVVVGYGVAVGTQLVLFPLFGIDTRLPENLTISAVFTIVSLGRSYAIRRIFER
jgi:hypothetical protein